MFLMETLATPGLQLNLSHIHTMYDTYVRGSFKVNYRHSNRWVAREGLSEEVTTKLRSE